MQTNPLLQAIFDNPEDKHLRLVYADYLEESGNIVRAEFIRLQIEIEEINNRLCSKNSLIYPKEWIELDYKKRKLKTREKQLRENEDNWYRWVNLRDSDNLNYTICDSIYLDNKYNGVPRKRWIEVRFKNGFIDEVTMDTDCWMIYGYKLLANHPVTTLSYTDKIPANLRGKSGGSRRAAWFHEGLNNEDTRSPTCLIPTEVCEFLPVPKRRRYNFHTAPEAQVALTAALIKWGREKLSREG